MNVLSNDVAEKTAEESEKIFADVTNAFFRDIEKILQQQEPEYQRQNDDHVSKIWYRHTNF